jgi:hypothetical protein
MPRIENTQKGNFEDQIVTSQNVNEKILHSEQGGSQEKISSANKNGKLALQIKIWKYSTFFFIPKHTIMKSKRSLLFVSMFLTMFIGASAQRTAYLVLEYMHVKPGNDSIYMQVENFWRKIHLSRQKDSTILDWGVWTVVLPSDMNSEYQYVVATVYPSFNAYLNSYANLDVHKIFPGISDDSLNHMFTKTAEARDLLRSSVFQILFSENLGGKPVPKYVLYTQMKAEPGKESDYESLETKDWRPVHKDLIKNGYESAFNFSRLLFPSDAKYPYNYAIFRFYDDAKMFDMQDKIDFNKYMKANPTAFSNAGKLRTEVHTELLNKVISLEAEPK